MIARKYSYFGAVCLLSIFLSSAPVARGYSVLTHEAIIDSVWDMYLQKLLLKRFPNATSEELEKYHAYAYCGCFILELGYFPFGIRLLIDLTQYITRCDFIYAFL